MNVLWRSSAFKLGSDASGLRLVPEIASAQDLTRWARQSLTRKILDHVEEPPHPSLLSQTLFGTEKRQADARALIDWSGSALQAHRSHLLYAHNKESVALL